MNPAVVTISFMPDGTNMGSTTSNLIGTFNGNPVLNNRWQTEILRAAQTWAQQTNLNFVVVPDDGVPSGAGNYQEGDPGHGDIRIGGYNFGNTTLACTYQPPPVNNYSIAGDITINTGLSFNIGQTYDLFTVAAHEFGHALGLGETNVSNSSIVMYPTYVGVKKVLASDDIAGIESIYSAGAPRSPDVYGSSNTSFATAVNLNSQIDQNALTGLVPNMDMTSVQAVPQADYFTFNAPAGTSGTMKVDVQSSGLSLFAPKLYVYSASQAQVAYVSGAGQYGTTITATVSGVTAGQQYFVKVIGADSTAFATGRYALGLSFNGSTPPTEASQVIAYANALAPHSGGGTANSRNGQNSQDNLVIGPGSPVPGSRGDGLPSPGRNGSGLPLLSLPANGLALGSTEGNVSLGAIFLDVQGNTPFVRSPVSKMRDRVLVEALDQLTS
jgi:hypothetical protein